MLDIQEKLSFDRWKFSMNVGNHFECVGKLDMHFLVHYSNIFMSFFFSQNALQNLRKVCL